MANTFTPSKVPQQLIDEVEARADGLQLMKWSAQRFPWIHVLSCSSACNGNYSPLGNVNTRGRALSFLSGVGGVATLSGYNSATGLPFPVIDGLDIKAMGSLGTTRKAVLKITCYTDEELIELQKCYFIPGMDVRVQWGWNTSCNQKSPPPLITDASLETSKATRKINALRKKYSNYDGFQGIVSNFGYKLNSANAWECDVEFISAADPFTDSNITNSDHPCSREVETDKGESVESWGPIYAAFRDMFKRPLEASRITSQLRSKAPTSTPATQYYYSYKEYEGVERTEGGADDSSWYSGIFGGVETNELFVNLKMVLDIINVTQIPNEAKKFPYGHITCNNVKLPRPKKALSSDPRVCYLPNSDNKASTTPFNHIFGSTDGSIDCVSGDYVRLDNIMVNIVFLLVEYKRAAEGDGKLSTFVNAVLDGINRVCGSPWTFALVSDESDDKSTGAIINIIDSKQAIDETLPFQVPGTISDSTLRDFGLDLKMTGAMKTQALYANNQQKSRGYGQSGGDATGCTGQSTKAFYLGGDIKNKAKPPNPLPTDSLNCDSSADKAKPPTLTELVDELYSDVNDATCGALLEGLVKELNDDTKKRHCAGVPLPFDFSFTMDGIGGFEFGQLVSSNRIPKAIRDEFRWQVTKVEHSITANDWSTTVSTVCRAQPKL